MTWVTHKHTQLTEHRTPNNEHRAIVQMETLEHK